MSNHLALATVTASLQTLLDAAVKTDVTGGSATIVRPDSTNELPTTGVNIYLYQVTPNTAMRNTDLPTRNSDGQCVQRPCVALDLHYLLTFHGTDQLASERVLGSVVRTLHTTPVLDRDIIENTVSSIDELNDSDLAQAIEQVKFSPMSLSLEELSKLWSVFFQTPYCLSMAYQASVVLISPDYRPVMAQPVIERFINVHPTTELGDIQAAEPDALTDLQLWLRADAAITHDNHGLVARWDDQSGNENHATQTTDDNKPLFVRNELNGKPVMRFDGTDDYFAINNMHYDTQGQISGITIFALVKSSSDNDQIVASFDRSNYWRLAMGQGSNNGIGWHTASAANVINDVISPHSSCDNKWHLVAVSFDVDASPNKQIFLDGELAASADAHPGVSMGTGDTRFGFIGVGSEADTFNGARGPMNYFAGDLAELLIYQRALSDKERQQIEKYFLRKYSS